MIDIHQPCPSRIPMEADARLAVPLRLPPIFMRFFLAHCTKRLLHITIHGLIAVITWVKIVHPLVTAAVHIIHLDGIMTSPAEHHGVGMHPLLQFIPALALDDDLDPRRFDHVRNRKRQRLPRSIIRWIQQGEGGPYAFPLRDAVSVLVDPAGFRQDPLRLLDIAVGEYRLRIPPRQLIVDRISRGAVTFQDPIH